MSLTQSHEQIYDLSKIDPPDMAYLSVSETPIKANSKAYTYGFEYTMCPWEDMHKVTARFSYSTMIFKDGHRLKENVIGYGNIFIFDIDSKPNKPSYRAEQVIEAVRGLKTLVVSTRSHTSENHRLRLLLLADKCANVNMTATLYEEVMRTIIIFCGLNAGMFDQSCFGIDRQYAPNPTNQRQYYIEGELLPMEFKIELAQKSLERKQSAKPISLLPLNTTGRGGDLKEKRSFIKERLSFELMGEVLEERGLIVKRDGSVTVPGNPTDALHIDRRSGLLRDFANDTSFDPVSVLHDYYKVPLNDATNYIYEKVGGTYG